MKSHTEETRTVILARLYMPTQDEKVAFREAQRILAENCDVVDDFALLGFVKAPAVGDLLKCLLCAQDKPWGTWDSVTGAAVCTDCRDAAYKARTLPPEGPLLRCDNTEAAVIRR